MLLKYLVLKTFQDKETMVVHAIGEAYETGDSERADYLRGLGYIGDDKPQSKRKGLKAGVRDEPGQVKPTDNDPKEDGK